MPILKSLNFVSAPDLRRSPEQHRRGKLLDRLQEQKSLLANPNFTRTLNRWVTHDGNRVREPQHVKVKPWWSRTLEGRVVLIPKFGLRPIEFEKGKPGTLLEKEASIGETLDALIAATNAGELDQLLARSKPKSAKA